MTWDEDVCIHSFSTILLVANPVTRHTQPREAFTSGLSAESVALLAGRIYLRGICHLH